MGAMHEHIAPFARHHGYVSAVLSRLAGQEER
jgi:hypothetical protein